MKIGNRNFNLLDKTAWIMGILNLTPDSFSDGNLWTNKDRAIDYVAKMIDDGADLIDIGGESTRPGHTQISTDEECSRIIPTIEALHQRFDIPLSVDCYRSKTAIEAINAGCAMINDIWGLTYDKLMAETIAKHQVVVCIMHNRTNENYTHFLPDVIADIKSMLEIAQHSKIDSKKIILDPGIGFAKNRLQDIEILKNLDLFRHCFNLPLLLGTSRKRVIAHVLDVPIDQRDHGTAATTVIGYMRGAKFFRVHNVAENRHALNMAMALN